MKTLLLLSVLLLPLPSGQTPATADESSPVVVLSFKWSKARQTIEAGFADTSAPAAAVLPLNKNFERNVRSNNPTGARDPNADTVEGRSAALEKSVQESRNATKPVDGFAYRVKIRNASTKVIEVLFWEYQFKESTNPAALTRRQFLCGVNIKPDKDKDVQAFILSGPSDVVTVAGLANKSGNLFQEKVVLNRVEYADGSIWQRKDWNSREVKVGIERALKTPWGSEMCRGLH